MKDKLQALMKKPQVAHILRMSARYNNRLGNQFAGAATYFSVLAMVPILMFAFSMLGMTLTVIRPDWLDSVKVMIGEQLSGAPGDSQEKLVGLIDGFLKNWRGVGIIGLLSALYAGSGWISNLKSAVRAQWTKDFETENIKDNIVIETVKNMGTLIVLLLMGGLTFALAQVATSLTSTLVEALHLEGVPGIGFLLRLLPLVLSLAAGWCLFLFLFFVLPNERVSKKAWMRGSLIGAAGLVLLQFLTGILMGSFTKNPAAALFGPVIVIMLFFNLFARVTLYAAAWIATSNQPAVARKWTEADAPLRRSKHVNAVDQHWELAEEDRLRQEQEKAEAEQQRADALDKMKGFVTGRRGAEEAETTDAAQASEATKTRAAATTEATGAGQPASGTTTAATAGAATTRPEWSASARRIVDGTPREYAGGVEDRRKLDRDAPVSPQTAVRTARASLAFGYVSGLATGAGLGALLSGGLRFLLRR